MKGYKKRNGVAYKKYPGPLDLTKRLGSMCPKIIGYDETFTRIIIPVRIYGKFP